MITRAVTLWRRGRGDWAIASYAALACALVALGYLAAKTLVAAATGGFGSLASEMAPGSLLLAATIYLGGHGLRILRLALLIGGWRVSLRTIVSFHLMTAAASLAVPLKLGEGYRVVELANVVGSFTRAVAIVWWERAFDLSIILLILLIALARASGTISDDFIAVGLLATGFIALTALIFFVVPDNLRRLSVLIIRRYSSARTVPVLKFVDVVRRAIEEAPRMVQGKVASLVTLTTLIWLCEIVCFAIVLPSVTLGTALDSLLHFLSAVTHGETLLGDLGKGKGTWFDERTLTYLAATQVPLVFLGLGAALHYCSWRIRQRV